MRVSVSVSSTWPPSHFAFSWNKRMTRFKELLINLLRFYFIFSDGHCGFHLDNVLQLPRPIITHLHNISDKQTLLVSWLVNHSSLVGDFYEIQISRTENHIIIYNSNITLFSVDSDEYTWTWTSDLPLECADHSVRIRRFYNKSVLSQWSNWKTNRGFQAENTTEMFPLERVLREGTTGMFCCVHPPGVNITNIIFDRVEYPLLSIGARVKAITVQKLTIPKRRIQALLLVCRDSAGNRKAAGWNFVSFPPQKPRNLSCVTTDMTAVICTWDSGRKRNENDRKKQKVTLNIENSSTPINCKLSSCIFPTVAQLEEYNIRVVVTNPLGEETVTHSFNISDRVSPVVEWDRVNPGVTDTTVSWIIQANLTQLNPVCQVTTDPSSITELSCNSVSGPCKVKLQRLLPNTCYSAKVRCSVNGRLWGQWTQALPFTTCPLVTLDVWRRIKQLSNPNSREVTLFWTPLVSGSTVTVSIQGYRVQCSQAGQNWTEWKDSGQTQTEVSIGPGQHDFTVEAVLHAGCNVTAHITIPQRDDGGQFPVERRFSSGTAAGFHLSWAEQDSATCGYTVEWCTLGIAVPCTLRWMKVSEGNNTLFLLARNFTAGHRYTFNIYGCTENGHRLLEIQSGYSQELKSIQPPSLVEPVQSTSSSVTLEWHYADDDPALPAFITGYLVTGQEAVSDTAFGHTANVFNVSVADPQKKSVIIEGLQQNQEYIFSVSALTKEGPGQPASITVLTRPNYSVHLAKILTPILLLLCCVVLLFPQRKILKSGLKGIFAYPAGMNIKTPELDNFLHETAERLQSQKVEECSSCDIEILSTRPPLSETTTLSEPEPLSTLPSPGSQPSPPDSSLSCLTLQPDYCPQSFTVLGDRADLQQTPSIINKTYFHTMVEDVSEAKVMLSEINEPFESLQRSCSVEYGYISSEAY